MIRKFNLYLLSEQVKCILYTKGLESIFNYIDYQDFKKRISANTKDKAEKIASLFIEYNNCAVSDYAEYIF
jgi:hypothetical protein